VETRPTALQWGRILAAIFGGYFTSLLLLFCAVAGYGRLLPLLGRGPLSAAEIDAFTARNSAWAASLTLLITAFVASAWAVLAVAPSAAQLHGVIIGIGLGVLSVLIEYLFGGLDLFDLLIAALAAGAGWIGALLGRRISGYKGG